MTPEIFTQATTIVKRPEGWDDEVHGVFHQFGAWVTPDSALSAWRPTKEEMALLNGGGIIVLRTIAPFEVAVTLDVCRAKPLSEDMARA